MSFSKTLLSGLSIILGTGIITYSLSKIPENKPEKKDFTGKLMSCIYNGEKVLENKELYKWKLLTDEEYKKNISGPNFICASINLNNPINKQKGEEYLTKLENDFKENKNFQKTSLNNNMFSKLLNYLEDDRENFQNTFDNDSYISLKTLLTNIINANKSLNARI